jgi:hypothetical protein
MTTPHFDDKDTIQFQYRLSIVDAIRARSAHSGEWNYTLSDAFVARLAEEGLDDAAMPYLSDEFTRADRLTITRPPPEGIFHALRARRDQMPAFARPEVPDGRRMASAALQWLPDLIRSRIERYATSLAIAATRRTSP